MAKYYVESGPVQLVFSADTAMDAAVKAFQWTCEQQAEIQAETPLEHLCTAEELGLQMHDIVWVNERGFGRRVNVWNCPTVDVLEAWMNVC